MDPETRDFLDSPEFVMPVGVEMTFWFLSTGGGDHLNDYRHNFPALALEFRIQDAAERLVKTGAVAS